MAETLVLGDHTTEVKLGLNGGKSCHRSICPESWQLQHGYGRKGRRREVQHRKLRGVVAADGVDIVVIYQKRVEIRWVVCHIQ